MLSDTDRRAIGQHFVCGFEGYEINEGIRKLVQDYYVGNIIIFKRNIQNIRQLHKLLVDVQQLAKTAGHTQPLLIGIDQENGQASAFSSTVRSDAGSQFPGAMAVASTGDSQLARRIANATACEMRSVGINWVFSPVADVNSEPLNPVIGIRAYGNDPTKASEFVCAVAAGLESAGLAACAKHFPGHGDTQVDSHLGLPVISKDLVDLERNELVTFRAAISSGISSVMTGHMVLPPLLKALGADEDTNIPATMSKGINSTLLRVMLGFEGVCVTDCFEMKAISDPHGFAPASVAFLRGGGDIAMICHELDHQIEGIEGVYQAVEKGVITRSMLDMSCGRIKALKEKVCETWENIIEKPFDAATFAQLQKENMELSRHAYSLTVQWACPSESALISPEDDVLVLTPQMESLNQVLDDPEDLQRAANGAMRNMSGPSYTAFASAIAMRAPFSTHIAYSKEHDGDDGTLSNRMKKAIASVRALVFATRNAHLPSGRWQLALLKGILAELAQRTDNGEPVKVFVVVSCNPYDKDMLAGDDVTKDLPCLLTYEFTKCALEEAAARLYGESLDA